MDVHTYQTYASDVLSFLFGSYKSRVGSVWRTFQIKTEYRWKNTPRQTRRARTNVDKCNNRLGVDMNTELVVVIPDKVVHDVKNQATKVRRDGSFRWIPDAAASPWPADQTALLHYGDDAATFRCCPDVVTLLLHVRLFHKVPGLILVDLEKKNPEQKLKHTGAKYVVTTFGGRQRHNASTRESPSGANVLPGAAASIPKNH